MHDGEVHDYATDHYNVNDNMTFCNTVSRPVTLSDLEVISASILLVVCGECAARAACNSKLFYCQPKLFLFSQTSQTAV